MFAVCCAVAFVRIYLYIYIYTQPFSVAKLNVSLFFLFQSSTCLLAGVAPGNARGLKLERFHQRNASPTHIYIYVLFVSIRTLLACRNLSRYSGSVR